MEAVILQEPDLFQRFSLLFSEIFSINERLQLLGTEAWFVMEEIRNKYAIYAYTHGPVTGSGSCFVFEANNTKLLSTVVELRVLVPPSLPPLFRQCEAHGPPIGVGREKNITKIFITGS